MTDAEKKVLDEEVVVESVDVEVGTMEDVDAIMKKFDRESNTRVWEGTPKLILRYVLAAFMLFMVYMNLWATWSGQIRRCLFVGFVILFTFFIYPVKKGNVKPNSMMISCSLSRAVFPISTMLPTSRGLWRWASPSARPRSSLASSARWCSRSAAAARWAFPF